MSELFLFTRLEDQAMTDQKPLPSTDGTKTTAIRLSGSHESTNSQPERTPMLTKRCPKCHTDKDVTQFYIQRTAKDGRYPWCKSCHREYRRNRNYARVTVICNPITQHGEYFTDEFTPNVLFIPIRADEVVKVGNVPSDLTRREYNRIERILMSLADDEATDGGRP